MPEWTIAMCEVRYFFRDPRSAKWIPLALLAAILGLWPYIGSSFVPVTLVTVAGLEPLYANALHRWPGHFSGHAVSPMPWEKVILGKNLAAVLETLGMCLIVSIVTLYASPVRPGRAEAGMYLLYLVMTVPLLLIVGNELSVREARTTGGWELADAAGALLLLAFAGICSLPFLFVVHVIQLPLAGLCVAPLPYFFWVRFSVRRTARIIRETTPDLCLTAS